MIVRHELLARLVRLWKENRLLEDIDRLPIQLTPRKAKVQGRCCVHKERAVWRYKALPLLGLTHPCNIGFNFICLTADEMLQMVPHYQGTLFV